MVSILEGSMVACPDCGVLYPEAEITPHAYLGGSTGCWAAYTKLLAREYEDARYFAAHRYTVDAYTTQHPGDQSDRRAAQSVNIHLAALCALIDQERPKSDIPHILGTLAKTLKGQFEPLAPPAPDAYAVTIKDVLKATNAQSHGELTRAWAEDVWHAYERHHDWARTLVKMAFNE